jgi:hypothetical protein
MAVAHQLRMAFLELGLSTLKREKVELIEIAVDHHHQNSP